MLVTEPIR